MIDKAQANPFSSEVEIKINIFLQFTRDLLSRFHYLFIARSFFSNVLKILLAEYLPSGMQPVATKNER